MHTTTDLSDFVRRNQEELRYVAVSICKEQKIDVTDSLLDDILQDFFKKLHEENLLGDYNPNYNGAPCKLSTYLFPYLKNIIRGYRKTEMRERRHRFSSHVPDIGTEESTTFHDEVDMAVGLGYLNSSYVSAVKCNEMSDSPEGLGADLREFFERVLMGATNRHYSLCRRRNKSVETSGCDLKKIGELLMAGLSNREIAQNYGVSDMFITNIKRHLGNLLLKYGVIESRPKRHRKALVNG